MSDPMSRHEIEDVLSSIRRLVAQDDGAAPGGAAPARSGKLILSPACRVSAGRAAVASSPESAQPVEDPTLSPGRAGTGVAPALGPLQETSLEATIAELEAAISARTDEVWEAECGDPPAYRSAPAPQVPQTDDTGPDAEVAADAPPPSPDEAPMMSDAPTLPAADNVHRLSTAPLRSAKAARLAGPHPEQDAPQPTDPVAAAPVQPPPQRPEDRTDGSRAAAAQAATSTSDETPDDDGPDGQVPFGLLDEAALRDLVAEILRDELQGVLGQRITRNVRKMVRAEIAQALASRNLD